MGSSCAIRSASRWSAGLVVSQVLTLFTTPVIYLAFDRLERRMAARRAPSGAAGNEASGARGDEAPA